MPVLKKGNRIFAGLFLLSMLFTVFNYLPIIEEENPSQRLELCKKNEQSGGDEDASTEKSEPSPEELIVFNSPFLEPDTEAEHFVRCIVLPCTDYTYSHIKPPPEA